jgi:glutamate--cysteine ligase
VKPKSDFRIGTEHEKTPFTLEGHRPVPYEGARGIRAVLEGMQLLLGWEPIMENGNIIGLYDVTGGGAISLEPGGQFELSGAPVETIHQTSSELMAHLAQVREVAAPLGIGFLGLGMTPSWSREEIPVMPKGRYRIMTNYMPKVGQYGLDMMYRTCTVQTNLDFCSKPTWSRSCACRWRCSRCDSTASRIRRSPKARPMGSCRSVRKSGATPTMRAPG